MRPIQVELLRDAVAGRCLLLDNPPFLVVQLKGSPRSILKDIYGPLIPDRRNTCATGEAPDTDQTLLWLSMSQEKSITGIEP